MRVGKNFSLPVLLLILGFIVGGSLGAAYANGLTTVIGDFFVDGTVTIQDGTEGLGKVLTSDSGGTGSWKDVTGTQGPQGDPGSPGANGQDGTSCSVTSISTFEATITCTDGTSSTLNICENVGEAVTGIIPTFDADGDIVEILLNTAPVCIAN